MPEKLFSLDQSKWFYEQEVAPHNRWHPDVPPVASVSPGAEFRLDCREWFDGTVHNDDSADDIRNLDLSIVHPLSGLIAEAPRADAESRRPPRRASRWSARSSRRRSGRAARRTGAHAGAPGPHPCFAP